MYFVMWENHPLKKSNVDHLADEFLTHERDKTTFSYVIFILDYNEQGLSP